MYKQRTETLVLMSFMSFTAGIYLVRLPLERTVIGWRDGVLLLVVRSTNFSSTVYVPVHTYLVRHSLVCTGTRYGRYHVPDIYMVHTYVPPSIRVVLVPDQEPRTTYHVRVGYPHVSHHHGDSTGRKSEFQGILDSLAITPCGMSKRIRPPSTSA
jgi:hypothetical protein